MTVAEIRKRLGMTQAELADKIGCSQGAISMYEKGQRSPSPYYALKIVKLIGLGKEAAFDLIDGGKNAVPGKP